MNTPIKYTLLVSSTLTILAGATIAPGLPAMQAHFADLNHSEFLTKLVLTITGLAIAISSPFIGMWVDKANKRKILLLALLLFACSGASGYFFDHSILALLVGRVLLGLAVAGVMVSVTTIAVELFAGPQLHKFMGLQAAFGGFGGVLFMGLGSFLAAYSWQAPFLLYGFSLLLLPFVYYFLLDHSKASPSQHSAESNTDTAQIAPPATNKKLLILCCLFGFVEVFTLYLLPVHFPFYLQTINQPLSSDDAWQSGIYIAYLLLVLATTSIFYPFFRRHADFKALQCSGFLLVAVAFVCLSEVTKPLAVLAVFTIAGLGFGLLRPNLVAWLMSQTPPQARGKTMGLLTTCFFLAQFLVPLFTQVIVVKKGYAFLFVTMGVGILTVASVFALKILLNKHLSKNQGVFSAN